MEAQVAAHSAAPLILTLSMDERSHVYFDGLRQRHYPAALNRIAAHLTLFHKLPQTPGIVSAVKRAAAQPEFPMRVTGLRSLGRGVAFGIESVALMAIHRELTAEFAEHLSAQDKQKFWPHVVVQNKAVPEQARELKARLEEEFSPFTVHATGLALWRYLGGPWELAQEFSFSS